MTAVTPVRTESPEISVACPTRTPATSVIALRPPGGSTPIRTPCARARGRGAGGAGGLGGTLFTGVSRPPALLRRLGRRQAQLAEVHQRPLEPFAGLERHGLRAR